MPDLDLLFNWQPLAALAALLFVVIEWFKAIGDKQWKAVNIQLAVWVTSFGLLWLGSATDYAPNMSVGGLALSDLNLFSIVFAGLVLGGVASTAFKVGANAVTLRDALKERAERPPVTVVANAPTSFVQAPAAVAAPKKAVRKPAKKAQ